jgi:hypothetical protein
MLISLTAALGSGNETVFNVVDSDGAVVDLTALGATVVTVEVCGPLINNGSGVTIDSTTDDVTFSNDIVRVKFGQLELKSSPPIYYPKISYITAAEPQKEVIVGEGYKTEIKLKVVC